MNSTNSLRTSDNNDPYIVQTDQAELARLQEAAGIHGAPGYGDMLTDDASELAEMLGEFGITVDLPGKD